ncbi:MAG: hypothetical protein IJF87_03255 [Erysipelotrichaceae bacterium]|nr:hypothetical protein [Erysipelotrichaceae bacterium]
MLYRINIIGSRGDKVKIAIPFEAVKLVASNEKAMEAFKKNRIMKEIDIPELVRLVEEGQTGELAVIDTKAHEHIVIEGE